LLFCGTPLSFAKSGEVFWNVGVAKSMENRSVEVADLRGVARGRSLEKMGWVRITKQSSID
jgi:hypothetical protein